MLDASDYAPSCDAPMSPSEQPRRRQYTLKGVETEAIELMRSAAQHEGMKISAWVSQRLRQAAEQSLANDASAIRKIESREDDVTGQSRDDLKARIGRLESELDETNRLLRTLTAKILERL